MKKVFSLILAVAMVLSLASVAFADFTPWTGKDDAASKVTNGVVKYDNTKAFTYDADDHYFKLVSGTNPTFGKTIYYPLFVSGNNMIATQDKAVSGLKLDYAIENAAAYVKSVSIVKKYGFISASDNYYFFLGDTKSPTNVIANASNKKDAYYIAVETQGSSTSSQYVSGVITLTGKSGEAKLKDEAVHFDFTLAWGSMATSKDGFEIKLGEDNSSTKLVTASTSETNREDVEFTVDNYPEVKFTVDMVDSEKLVIKYSDSEVDAIVDANEEAGITFYNFNGASFKRAGDLFFEQDLEDEDAYLYEIMADGSLKNLSACYDEEEGGFLLKVKKLGFYCISDLPLVDADGTVAAAPGAVNPVTGAIA